MGLCFSGGAQEVPVQAPHSVMELAHPSTELDSTKATELKQQNKARGKNV